MHWTVLVGIVPVQWNMKLVSYKLYRLVKAFWLPMKKATYI